MNWLEGSPWPVAKVHHLFEVRGGTTPTSEPKNWGGDVRWATPVDLRPVHGGYLPGTDRTLTESGAGSKGLTPSPAGSVILSCRAPIGYVAISQVAMATNQGCKSLVPLQRLDSRFFRYQLEAARPVLEAKGRGSTFVEISGQAVAEFPVAVPSLEVQRRVADMLDAETARIDTLITKNQTVLDSLAQRIVSLRAELLWPTEARRAWTGNPLDAPTSAVPSATKVQYAVPVRVAGGTPATGIDAYWSEDPGDLPWFGVGDFTHGYATDEPSRRVTDSGVVAAGLQVLQRGDLLLAMYGATSGKAGVLSEPGTTNQAVMAMRSEPRVLRQDYLVEWFNFARPYAYEKAESRSSTQPNLNAGQIEQFSIRCPPLSEQDTATKALAQARAVAAALRRRVERQIELLRTRRQALITAAVMGQITV